MQSIAQICPIGGGVGKGIERIIADMKYLNASYIIEIPLLHTKNMCLNILSYIRYFTLAFILLFMTFGCGGGGGGGGGVEGNGNGISASPAPSETYSGSVPLAWAQPLTNSDGSPLTDLAGYIISYGASSGAYDTMINTGNTTQFTITNLPPGTYHIVLQAYDTSGNKSSYSNEAVRAVY